MFNVHHHNNLEKIFLTDFFFSFSCCWCEFAIQYTAIGLVLTCICYSEFLHEQKKMSYFKQQ